MFIAVEATSLEAVQAGVEHEHFLTDLTAVLGQGDQVEVVSPLLARATSLGALFDQLVNWTDYITTATFSGGVVVADGWLLTACLRALKFGARWWELFYRTLPHFAHPDLWILRDYPAECLTTRRWLFERALFFDAPFLVHTPDQPLNQVVEFIRSCGPQGGEKTCPLIQPSGESSLPLVSA